MIIVIEGPDGTGKTTLAREIYDQTKGHVLHCTWNKDWDMKQYFTEILETARKLEKYQTVVIDRWAPSEWVYGHVFRGGPQFDIFEFLDSQDLTDIKWIICKNVNAVFNHVKNSKERVEMFDDMTDVVSNFTLFSFDTPQLDWIEYDFDKNDTKEFVKDLL
jgi:thymidylate kinase